MHEHKITIKSIFEKFTNTFLVSGKPSNFLNDFKDPIEGRNLEEIMENLKLVKERMEKEKDQYSQHRQTSIESVDDYMKQKNNFTEMEWKAIQTFRSDIESYKKEFQIATQGASIRQIVQEGRKRNQKQKNNLEKQQNIAEKKKNWIPM